MATAEGSNGNSSHRGERPTGYWIALPEGWISLDVDPSTSPAKLRQVLDAAERFDEDVRKNRAKIEQLFGQLLADASVAGVQSCACLFTMVDDILPMQASLTVAVRSLQGELNDVAMMFQALSEDEIQRTVEVVELDTAGVAVRRSGWKRQAFPGLDQPLEFISRQFYVPVPNVEDEVVLLTFASPTLDLEAELCELFDSMAKTLTFTYEA